LRTFLINQAKKNLKKSITRPPKEAIIVLLDISVSMSVEFAQDLERIGIVKALF